MRNLIILHGAIGSKKQFDKLMSLLEKEWKVYTLDFYGHGGSKIDQNYRIEKFADQLETFIQDQNIQDPTIFGYSMGGMVALELASRNSTAIKRIITLGTKFKWSPEIAQKEIKMLAPDVISEKIPKFAQALSERHSPEDWKKVLNQTAEMMLYLGENPPTKKESWSTIHTPTDLCLADHDEMVSETETKEIHTLLSNATFTTISDSKHPIEQVNLDQIVTVINSEN